MHEVLRFDDSSKTFKLEEGQYYHEPRQRVPSVKQFRDGIKLSKCHSSFFFFFNDPAPTEIYPLSLHAALPISSFALEVAQGLPTALTLAAGDAAFAKRFARELHQPMLRVYFSTDLAGVEISGAVKNIMAIPAGISDGLGLGMNARAALITRGLVEITRLGVAMGGRSETFMGLAGAGGLILTCIG